jgi:hypothetical protein
MGSHVNYYWIIQHLVVLKGEFHRISKERYLPLIKELSSYEVYPHSDNEHLPDHKTLAVKLKFSQSKLNSLLRELLEELVFDFRFAPVEIKNHVHQLFIHVPRDEEHGIPNKKYVEESRKQNIYLELILPVTPQLGEEVTISFLAETGKYYRGYVHEIKHNISGSTQEIQLSIHPWNNYYYKWVKTKEDYDRNERWKPSLRNS